MSQQQQRADLLPPGPGPAPAISGAATGAEFATAAAARSQDSCQNFRSGPRGSGGKRSIARRMATQPSATATAAAAAVTVAVGRAKPRRRSRALAVLAAASSALSAVLFLTALVSGAWESVSFDFAAVNASLRASAATKWGAQRALKAPLRLLTSSGLTAGLVLLPAETIAPSAMLAPRGNESILHPTPVVPAACLLDMRGGLWSVCNLVDQNNPHNRALYFAHCRGSPLRNASCFSYISDGSALRAGPAQPAAERSQPESQIMKMQNNTISCCIVVILCIMSSIITGAIGVGARVVPSITVTGVLYLTSGIFVSFGNSIEHEKISRMLRRPQTSICVDCACYSLVKTPEEFCSAAYRSVKPGWSLIPSWASAVCFLIASIFWLCLSRSVRIEKSKSML